MGFSIIIKKRKKRKLSPSTTSTSSTGPGSTGSWSAVVPLVKKKVVIKCDKCGKNAAEYYEYVSGLYPTILTATASSMSTASISSAYTSEEGEGTYCKTCHQINKLIE